MDLKVIPSSSSSSSSTSAVEIASKTSSPTKSMSSTNSRHNTPDSPVLKPNYNHVPLSRSPYAYQNDSFLATNQSQLTSSSLPTHLHSSSSTKTKPGLGSLGMSALFYSFLKNNAKNINSPPGDSGYDSRQDSSLNNSNLSSTTMSSLNKSQQQNLMPTTNNTASPITQMKLKNLQEALAKHYSKEQLSQLGIVIPNISNNSTQQQYAPRTHSNDSFNDKENFSSTNNYTPSIKTFYTNYSNDNNQNKCSPSFNSYSNKQTSTGKF